MANTFERKELFENTPVSQAVMKLCIPTILSSLVTLLYNLADTYFVGMLNDPAQTSAVTLAFPVLLAFIAVNNLFGVGTGSMMSRALGRGDMETLRRSSAFGFWGAFAGGVMFSVLCTVFRAPLVQLLGVDATTLAYTNAYMNWTVTAGAIPAILNVVMSYLVRSEGATMHASIGAMSGCILNILLDPIFILYLGMESEGAALATFISNCVAVLYFFGYLFLKRDKTLVCIDPRMLKGMKMDVPMGVCAVGVPAAIQNLLNVTGTTIFNNLASGYGTQALAAMGICQKINQVPMYIAMGMGQGIMPLVSYTYAAKMPKRMKDTIGVAMKFDVVFLFSCAFLYYIFSGTLVGAFIEDAQTVAYGTKLLRGFCLGIPFLSIDFLAIGIYQATGKGAYSLGFAILRKIVLEIPFMIFFNKVYPLYGLSYSQASTEFILTVISMFVLVRLIRNCEAAARPSGSVV